MSNTLLQQIEDRLPEMTGAQRKVAEYILQNSTEAAFSTIDKIAHAAGVSTTSVIRLGNLLDFSAFSEFQRALKGYVQLHLAPIHKLSLNTAAADPEAADRDDLVSEVYRCELENLESVLQTLRTETLTAVAQRLEQAEHIYIFGARTSESVARYLEFDLGRMYLNVSGVGESPSEQLKLFQRIGPRDVLIAVTISRYNRTVCGAAARCRELGIPVIGLTDSFSSPLAESTDHLLVAKCRSNAFHNSISGLIFLCDALIKACTQVSAKRVRENLKRDEDLVKEMRFFVR